VFFTQQIKTCLVSIGSNNTFSLGFLFLAINFWSWWSCIPGFSFGNMDGTKSCSSFRERAISKRSISWRYWNNNTVNQLMYNSFSQAINQSIDDRSVSQSLCQSLSHPVSLSVFYFVSLSVCQLVNKSVSRPACKSHTHWESLSVCQSVRLSVCLSSSSSLRLSLCL